MKRTLACLLSLMLGQSVSPVEAHHSGAMFDRYKTVELQGVVKEYQYQNPHVWIRLIVRRKDEQPVEWDIEGGSPNFMENFGITSKAVRAGDHISMHIHPLKDGRNGGALIDITLANGKLLTTNPSAPELGKPKF